ncbi:MAG: tripartite tricarboxylate transporter substrate binding protein [Pigmentiphaga sp.]|uniref:Bug family tripartite tricarboxylate transporter substrate binding protein n=1 Tax=Pigmentiphaga sp. TaxID=1977564 RepID=UPI0029AACB60|nr:tripartite tricarboxylate transporter substrate binding protein [Pigmentiphaga sp.]MDX3906545.1 tripartite tricarboxylate transporter substrate binding protein [Pigmentiphaga sp.]
MIVRRRLLAGSLALASAAFALPAPAQDAPYPARPIRFVVPYPPGGPLDVMARALAEKVRPALGQPVIVENKPGAGGNIGAYLVARSAPDGYTIVMGAVATHAINPALFPSIPYDPVKDFSPIVLVASVPNVLVMNPATAAKLGIGSVQDLVRYGRQHPGQLNMGSGGNGSAGHLAGELLKTRAGVFAAHIPYAGATPAQMALLAGQTDFMFDNLAAASALIGSGKLKALAVTTATRSRLLPEIPTMMQAGVPSFDLGTWFGIFAPAHTPEPVVQKLHQEFADVLKSPDMRRRLADMGSDAEPGTPASLAALVEADLRKYAEIVRISGAKLN